MKNNINLIGISGKVGVGKDLVGEIIQFLTAHNGVTKWEVWENLQCIGNRCSDWKIKKFATPIKQIAFFMTGISVEKMETQGDKNKLLPELDTYSDIKNGISISTPTVRLLLQKIGDIMLQIYPDWLLNVMFRDYISEPHPNSTTKWEGSKWIITDLRKPNEYNKIKKLGGKCIKMIKAGQDSKDNHISETALDSIKDWDYIIEAEQGDIGSLIKQTKEMLIKFKIL